MPDPSIEVEQDSTPVVIEVETEPVEVEVSTGGPTGPQGPQGPQGIPGPAGSDGFIVIPNGGTVPPATPAGTVIIEMSA